MGRKLSPRALRTEPGPISQANVSKGLKGVSPLLAGVMYVGIALAAITIIVTVGNPLVKNIQDAIAIDSAQDMLATLDRTVREVAAEGRGSTRVVPIEFSRGKLTVDEDSNQIFYELDTEADVISPGTRREIGNIFIASNTDVNVTSNSTHIIMENTHIRALFNKTGSETNFTGINLSRIITGVRFNLGEREEADFNGSVEILIDNNATKSAGTGYTTAVEEGANLAKGTVRAYVDNAYLSYTVEISLTGGDFLEISASNFTNK
jgi:hypothetical protein